MNIFDEMRNALSQAEVTLRAADVNAGHMARMLRGRLRYVGADTLKDLKRELKQFDALRGKWKS